MAIKDLLNTIKDDEFLVKLLMGIDPSKGLDREALIKGSRIYINRQLDAIN